jgi:hypothetical protein
MLTRLQLTLLLQLLYSAHSQSSTTSRSADYGTGAIKP